VDQFGVNYIPSEKEMEELPWAHLVLSNPEKMCRKGHLKQSKYGWGITNIVGKDLNKVEIPEDILDLARDWTRATRKQGESTSNQGWNPTLWLRILAYNTANIGHSRFGTPMKLNQVWELIRAIPEREPKPDQVLLGTSPEEDLLHAGEFCPIPTPLGWRFPAGEMFNNQRAFAVWKQVSTVKAWPTIQDIIVSGWNPQAEISLLPHWFASHDMSEEEQTVWDNEVRSLWLCGVVPLTKDRVKKYGLPQVIVAVFLVKETDKYRPIMDARLSNVIVTPEWFHLQWIQDFVALLSKDTWWFKCDVKSGWLHVKIHPQHSNYFAFAWKDMIFTYQVLAFGDATAPYCFTYLLVTLKRMLNNRKIPNVLYIDDLMCAGYVDKERANNQRNTVLKCQFDLNLVLGTKKCPEPNKIGEALGFIVDTKNGLVSLTQKKIQKMLGLLDQLKEVEKLGGEVPIKILAKLVGLMLSGSYVVQRTLFYCNQLIETIILQKGDWNARVKVNMETI